MIPPLPCGLRRDVAAFAIFAFGFGATCRVVAPQERRRMIPKSVRRFSQKLML
jgi:hypothetical protein